MSEGRLDGKAAVITGGSRGIGRAIVERFAAEGAKVMTCGRGKRPEDLAEDVHWTMADISDSLGVKKLRSATVEAFGGIDILVNNSGVQIEKTLPETTDEDWDQLMGVNAGGVFQCCRAVIPVMAEAGGGAIINIGSISGNQADPAMALYNASKAFVHGLTRSIAVDHGKDGIRCNAISPGWIMTGMADAAFELAKDAEAAKRDALARHAAGRFGEPADIAGAAVWLASDDAAFVTGQCITVDGGLTAATPLQPGLF